MLPFQMSDDDLNSLNKWLLETYGAGYYIGGERCGEDTDALWRVAWTDTLTERRIGTFRDYESGTKLFLREVKEERICLKYSFLPHKYVLEKNVYAPVPELPESLDRSHYELVFCFHDAVTQEPIPIIRDGIVFLIDTLTRGAAEAVKRSLYRTREQTDREQAKLDDQEIAGYKDQLLQDMSPTVHALIDREAIVVPEMKDNADPNP